MKNKMDVISAFAFDMYKANKTSCKEAEWYEFCRRYMDSTLFEFDDRHLLESLVSARIFFRFGHELYFKYKLFYSFFLGKYVANRQVVLSEFIRTDAYLATVDLVEVISASTVDNTQLISDLTDKLGESVRDFRTKYGLDETDPFVDFPWTVDEQEEEKIWEPLAKDLAAGPASPSELDKLKRSLLAEKRTLDQNVVLRKFDIAERKCFSYLYALVAALRNSDSIEGSLKKRAVDEIFAGFSCIYHVGLIFAPLIARHRAFVWNGVAFINAIEYHDDVRADDHKRTFLVMVNMANAAVKAASSAIGTRKLGEVFKALVLADAPCDFRWYLNYTCIIRSKPRLWNEVAERMVDNTDRRSFYLRNMLYETYRQFSEEVSTVKEREGLKRIIARVKTKRDLKKKNPSLKAVNRMLGRLERAEFFENKADES